MRLIIENNYRQLVVMFVAVDIADFRGRNVNLKCLVQCTLFIS